MDTGKVVVYGINRKRMPLVLNLFAMRVRQTGKTAHLHPIDLTLNNAMTSTKKGGSSDWRRQPRSLVRDLRIPSIVLMTSSMSSSTS